MAEIEAHLPGDVAGSPIFVQETNGRWSLRGVVAQGSSHDAFKPGLVGRLNQRRLHFSYNSVLVAPLEQSARYLSSLSESDFVQGEFEAADEALRVEAMKAHQEELFPKEFRNASRKQLSEERHFDPKSLVSRAVRHQVAYHLSNLPRESLVELYADLYRTGNALLIREIRSNLLTVFRYDSDLVFEIAQRAKSPSLYQKFLSITAEIKSKDFHREFRKWKDGEGGEGGSSSDPDSDRGPPRNPKPPPQTPSPGGDARPLPPSPEEGRFSLEELLRDFTRQPPPDKGPRAQLSQESGSLTFTLESVEDDLRLQEAFLSRLKQAQARELSTILPGEQGVPEVPSPYEMSLMRSMWMTGSWQSAAHNAEFLDALGKYTHLIRGIQTIESGSGGWLGRGSSSALRLLKVLPIP